MGKYNCSVVLIGIRTWLDLNFRSCLDYLNFLLEAPLFLFFGLYIKNCHPLFWEGDLIGITQMPHLHLLIIVLNNALCHKKWTFWQWVIDENIYLMGESLFAINFLKNYINQQLYMEYKADNHLWLTVFNFQFCDTRISILYIF